MNTIVKNGGRRGGRVARCDQSVGGDAWFAAVPSLSFNGIDSLSATLCERASD